MKALLVLCMLVAASRPGAASPVAVDQIVRERIAAALPEMYGVVELHLPASLASLATETDRVAVELPRELRAGRASAKVTVRGKASTYVTFVVDKLVEVAVASHALPVGTQLTEADFSVERRAVAEKVAVPSTLIGSTVTRQLAANSAIGSRDVALAPPLARGTQITVEMRRGSVRVRGSATLEAAARSGEQTSARLAQNHTIVRGTLRGQTLFVGENP